MAFSNRFFDRVEKKTNVNKETILGLAKKLQDTDLKNEQARLDARGGFDCWLWTTFTKEC